MDSKLDTKIPPSPGLSHMASWDYFSQRWLFGKMREKSTLYGQKQELEEMNMIRVYYIHSSMGKLGTPQGRKQLLPSK